MKKIDFPVNFKFRISTFANDFTATDLSGHTIAYVRQKMFKLKEDIQVYNDESKSEVNFNIKADRWLDFSAAYSFTDTEGKEIGKVVRKGWRSLWKARYEVMDEAQQPQFTISEENAWIKVLDGLLGEIPVLGIFTGYLFNPAYVLTDSNEEVLLRLKKKPSFFGRKFEVEKEGKIQDEDTARAMLALMMMVLLERRRG
ncbi:hypothetical protein [Algivirga pacifica]|uniref:Uncharacterized protein n=1 Tax=Algivirga pacifica TaxID=1162670 RepID=A0ABP9D8A5_9BACT